MIVYRFRCSCGTPYESSQDKGAPCPDCGSRENEWRGMAQRPDYGADATDASYKGFRIPGDERHEAWLKSDATQARFRLPDGHPQKLEHVRKSDDRMHM